MHRRLIVLLVISLLGVVFATWWLCLRAASASAQVESAALARADAMYATDRAALDRRVVELSSSIAERRSAVLVTQTPAERARAFLGPTVARMKAAHAGRTPVKPPPPPPTAAGGGIYFPELMSDPEYSALYARAMHRSVGWRYGRALRQLGVAEVVVTKALDLLAEEEVSRMDLHNLAGTQPASGGLSNEYAETSARLRSETEAQVKALLGEEAYARYKERVEGKFDSLRFATQQLEQRLSYSDEPLMPEQVEKLRTFEAKLDYGSLGYFQKQAAVFRDARKTGVLPGRRGEAGVLPLRAHGAADGGGGGVACGSRSPTQAGAVAEIR